MLKVNEYFNGNVKSIALQNSEGEQTVGVMKTGKYEFSTSKKEYMFVAGGRLSVKLPGESEFKIVENQGRFEVEAHQSFEVEALEDSIYICRYE